MSDTKVVESNKKLSFCLLSYYFSITSNEQVLINKLLCFGANKKIHMKS